MATQDQIDAIKKALGPWTERTSPGTWYGRLDPFSSLTVLPDSGDTTPAPTTPEPTTTPTTPAVSTTPAATTPAATTTEPDMSALFAYYGSSPMPWGTASTAASMASYGNQPMPFNNVAQNTSPMSFGIPQFGPQVFQNAYYGVW